MEQPNKIEVSLENLKKMDVELSKSIITIKGEKGDKGEKGERGDKGETGFSPIVSVSQTSTGAIINITDSKGTTSANLYGGPKGDKGDTGATGPQGPKGDTGEQGIKGEAGYTPVKGTDYWTNADKTEIVNDVLAALPTWSGGAY